MPQSVTVVCQLRDKAQEAVHRGAMRFTRSQVAEYREAIQPGDRVQVIDARGVFVGTGFANPLARDSIHILSRIPDAHFDEHFFYERIGELYRRRQIRVDLPDAYRIVSSDADGLPGLIVDCYGDYLAVSLLSQGLERCRAAIVQALSELMKPTGIYECSDGERRQREGLPPHRGVLSGHVPPSLEVELYGVTYLIRPAESVGTGLFLDQRDDYQTVARFIQSEDRVLDAYCYTGGFALAAAAKGACVTGVDSSATAISTAREAAERNGFGKRCSFVQASCPEAIQPFEAGSFDVVFLDPPAHCGVKPSPRNVSRAYLQILEMVLPLLRRNGILAATARSSLMPSDRFLDLLASVSQQAGHSLCFLELLGQPWDFPRRSGHPADRYLTGVVARVA